MQIKRGKPLVCAKKKKKTTCKEAIYDIEMISHPSFGSVILHLFVQVILRDNTFLDMDSDAARGRGKRDMPFL